MVFQRIDDARSRATRRIGEDDLVTHGLQEVSKAQRDAATRAEAVPGLQVFIANIF
jgi:hypothetical protein